MSKRGTRTTIKGKGREHYLSTLVAIRNALGERKYGAIARLSEDILANVKQIARRRLLPLDRENLVADYFFAKLSRKIADNPAVLGDTTPRPSTQVIAIDPTGKRLLAQRRGDYKRLFASSLTVSANAKAGADPRSSAAASLWDECGLAIDDSRFYCIGTPGQFGSQLQAIQFVALADIEERGLQRARQQLESIAQATGLILDYRPRNRVLTVMSVGASSGKQWPDIAPIDDSLVDQIREVSRVKPTLVAEYVNEMSLVAVRLTEQECRVVAEKIDAQRRDLAEASQAEKLSPTRLDVLDRDVMEFLEIEGLPKLFHTRPREFALDLTLPYFAREEVMSWLGGDILPIEDPRCGRLNVAGGKGVNTHRLARLREKQRGERASTDPAPDESLPTPLPTPLPTLVISTEVFARHVLGDSVCRFLLDSLEESSDRHDVQRFAEQLRVRIEQIDVPAEFRQHLEREIDQLRGSARNGVAIRSSATIEDLPDEAAAGQAHSFLNVFAIEDVIRDVKRVWASLYLDGFVLGRKARGMGVAGARMAVLVQQVVAARAAGVAFSMHPETGRPAYYVEAQPGIGISVVEGQGQMDRWVVGHDAAFVLEQHVAMKNVRTVLHASGGTKIEAIRDDQASLSDAEVLNLAKVLKIIREFYRDRQFAEEIDVEFCLDVDRQLYILQTRPKKVFKRPDSVTEELTVVDEAKVGAEVERFELEETAVVPLARAVSGRIYVCATEGGSATDSVPAGAILVIPHTNNSWNGVFPRLAGLVCAEGGMNSHAALNAPEYNVGCIVAAPKTLERLKNYHGKIVTLDPARRRVFLAEAPLTTLSRDARIWVETSVPTQPNSELLRDWRGNREARPDVFIEEFDGQWRHRSEALGLFQLDCYNRAWDRLTERMNERYEGRTALRLEPPERDFRVRDAGRARGTGLLTRMPVPEACNMVTFARNVTGFGVDDVMDLYNERARDFDDFERFLERTSRLHGDNVEEAVQAYIAIMSTMHFAFWLNQILDQMFVHQQLRYVDVGFQGPLREKAVQNLQDNRLEFVRSPSGAVVQLSVSKECDIHALTEAIRGNRHAVAAFEKNDPGAILRSLEKGRETKSFAKAIRKLSDTYKRSTEDIRVLNEANEYVNEVRAALAAPTPLSLDTLSSLWDDFAASVRRRRVDPRLADLRQQDPRLFHVLREAARYDLAHCGLPVDAAATKPGKYLAISCTAAEYHIGKILDRLGEHAQKQIAKMAAVDSALHAFPNLGRLAALSKLELVLREDGHHRLVPQQRRLARLMLDAARAKSPRYLAQPEDIFEIGAYEVVALLRDKNPAYVSRTTARWAQLQAAQRRLRRNWTDNRRAAFREYQVVHDEILRVLNQQIRQCSLPVVRAAYEQEIERLQNRLRAYERRL